MSEYKVIPILDAARMCGLPVLGDVNRAEVETHCPFCKDTKRRMSLNTAKNLFRCNRCKVSGNSVTLYAKLMKVDNRTAYNALTRGKFTQEATVARQEMTEKVEKDQPLQPLHKRHDVYFDLLNALTLSSRHTNNLLERGFDDDTIALHMYRTIPSWKVGGDIAERLAKEHDLRGVPGFYTSNGRWRMVCQTGMFIPVCDKNGYIQGLQVRLDDTSDRKYRWFSSRYKENGARAFPWVHVTGWQEGITTAAITEGSLKGDVASFLSNGCYVCLPGVNNISGLGQQLRNMGITTVTESFDMDKYTNAYVADALIALERELHRHGITMQRTRWDAEYKGIDDYLLAQCYPEAA